MEIPEKIRFCSVDELHEKVFITKWIDEWRDEISAIFIKEDNDIVVLSTICPHFGGDMELIQNPTRLRCKWHHWQFELKTGKCLSSMMTTCLRKYSFQQNNGFLEVTL